MFDVGDGEDYEGGAEADADDYTCRRPPGYLGQPQLEDCGGPSQNATPA